MRRALAAAGCLVSLLCPARAPAFQKPTPRDRVLPDFDSRVGAGRRPSVTSRSTAGRLELLQSRVNRAVRLRTHPVTGAMRVLWAEEGQALSDAAALPPLAAARRFVEENASLAGTHDGGGAGPRARG